MATPYQPTNWVDGKTPVNAANMTKIETELVRLGNEMPTPIPVPSRIYPCDLQIVPDETGLIKVRFAGIPDGADLSRYTVRLMRLTKNYTSKRDNGNGDRHFRFRETNPFHGSPTGTLGGGGTDFSVFPLMLNAHGDPTSDYPFYDVFTTGGATKFLRVQIGSKFSITNNRESNLILFDSDYVMDWSMLPSWLVTAWQNIAPITKTVQLRVRSGKRFRANYSDSGKSYFTLHDFGFALFDGDTKVSETRRFDLLCNIHVEPIVTNEQFSRGVSKCYPRLY